MTIIRKVVKVSDNYCPVVAADLRKLLENYLKSGAYKGLDKGLQLMFLECMSDAGLINQARLLFEYMPEEKRNKILEDTKNAGIEIPQSIIKEFF